MKALRIIGIALAALLVLLIAGVAFLYAWFDGDKIKAEISRAVLEQKQRTLVIAGQPQLSIWPNVGIELEGVSLSERASTTEFASLQSARIAVAVLPLLSKQVQVTALDVVGLKATLIKRKDGALNIADLLEPSQPSSDKAPDAPPADAPQNAEPLQIDVKSIRVANAQLTWRDERAGTTTSVSNLNLSSGQVKADTGQKTASVDALELSIKGSQDQESFELTLSAPQLLLSPEKSSSDTITLTAQLQGTQRSAKVNLTLGGVEGHADALNIGNLALTLDAKTGDTSMKGQLSSPVAVNVQAQTVALSKLAGQVELALPKSPVKQVKLPINGTLRADARKQSAALELATQFDESKIATSVQVRKFAPLALTFDLDIDKLNVDKYLPPKPAPTQEAGTGKEAPLDFSALKGPTVNGAIRIDALQASNLKMAHINAKVALSGGKLDVAPLSLKLYEGTASGNLSVNAHGNAVAVRQTLAGININPLLKDLLNKDMLEGRGTVALDIMMRGSTISAMKKALGGTASLNLKDGAIKGINLAQSLRNLKATMGQPDATQQANTSQKTDFSELSGTFNIANGVARNDDLAMKSPFIRLGGSGDIDVGQSQMNYLAQATVVSSGEGQGGQDLAQLKGLTIPVRLTGPFDKLSYKLELGAALEAAAKTKLQERVKEVEKEVQNKAQEKLKDAFKGLFGR